MLTTPAQEITLQNLIDQFWEIIPFTWRIVRNQVHAIAMESFAVTEDQWHILRHIRKGVNSVSELAQVRLITPSAVSQTVEVLVEKGLVERAQKCEDRRCVHLSLTEEGSNLVNGIFQLTRAWMLEKMNGLTADEIQTTLRGMQIIGEVFKS